MAIALKNPIMARVDDRASFLRHLLEEYPMFLNSWEIKQRDKFAKMADNIAGEDNDVKNSVYSSFLTAFDDDESRKDMFYQSIFLMCYSYYESCIAQLSQVANASEHIKAICNTKNIVLSAKSQEAIAYIQGDMNEVRNDICHNNFGTYKRASILRKVSEQKLGLDFSDNVLSFTNPQIIFDILDKMHGVLHELCEKLGYKTRIIK